MLQGLFKKSHTPFISNEDIEAKGWTATRVLADLLNRGPNLGTLTGAWTSNRTEVVRHIRHWAFVAIKARCNIIAKQYAQISIREKAYSETRRKWLIDKCSRKYFRCNKAMVSIAEDEVLTDAPSNHPVVELFRYPNSEDTHFQFCYEQEMFGCSTGNEYIWMPPNGFGKPSSMWVLPSHWVWPVVGHERIIQEYEIRPVEGGYRRLVFPADEILHIKNGKNPISKIDGYATMDAGSRWIDVSESTDQARWHTMKQGTFPSVAIELGPEFFDPSDEDILRVEQKWLSRYQGERRAGKPVILPPGMKVTPLMMSAREMDYIHSSEQIRDCILSLWGVPKFCVGINQDVQRNTAEAAMVQFFAMAINPVLEMRGQEYTRHFRKFWPEILVWYEDGSPADAAQLNADLNLDNAAQAILVDEIRELRGRAPLPDNRGQCTPQEFVMRLQMEQQKEIAKMQQEMQQQAQQGQMPNGGPGVPPMPGMPGGPSAPGPKESTGGQAADGETPPARDAGPGESINDTGHKTDVLEMFGKDRRAQLVHGLKGFSKNGKH